MNILFDILLIVFLLSAVIRHLIGTALRLQQFQSNRREAFNSRFKGV